MAPSPKVSILVPTYNYARFLPEALESVLRQDFSDFELIVSDDCSNDNSAEVLNHFALRDRRVQIQLHKKNLGMVANWNWCLGQARGEYVRYLFGDDCMAHPSALSQQVEALDKNPSAAFAFSARFTVDENTSLTGIWDEFKTSGLHSGPQAIVRCLLESSNLLGEPSAVMFRRTLGTRGFDPTLRQIVDLEMWFHLLTQGDAVYSAEPLCCFRQHGAQQTAVNRASQAGNIEMAQILRAYLPRLRHGDNQALRPSAINRVLFRAYIHLLKKDARLPALAAEIEWLRNQLTPSNRLVCWLAYRFARPAENLRRSIRKRTLRHRLRTQFADQREFISGLKHRASA
ncbi:MAG: glycosyltransferase family A protein [Nibricoccus sp.]